MISPIIKGWGFGDYSVYIIFNISFEPTTTLPTILCFFFLYSDFYKIQRIFTAFDKNISNARAASQSGNKKSNNRYKQASDNNECLIILSEGRDKLDVLNDITVSSV